MSLPKLLAIVSALLFGIIAVAVIFKAPSDRPSNEETVIEVPYETVPYEVALEQETQAVEPAASASAIAPELKDTSNEPDGQQPFSLSVLSSVEEPPEVDRIEALFRKEDPLPIVETITYKSRVSWQKGRPAWLSDYALHYSTSRHFIARSLKGKPDYFNQNVSEGDRFNVFRKDKKIEFYLVVDTSRCKMWFYCIDKDAHETTLLKTYQVGLGRLDASKASGLLTPLGKYTLGSKTAIYHPKTMGYHNGNKVEMVTVFGSRWIPFDKEIEGCTAPSKGFGIHGVPWVANAKGVVDEDNSSIRQYKSDGCIRMTTADVEELYATIITRPAIVEIVKNFSEAKVP